MFIGPEPVLGMSFSCVQLKRGCGLMNGHIPSKQLYVIDCDHLTHRSGKNSFHSYEGDASATPTDFFLV